MNRILLSFALLPITVALFAGAAPEADTNIYLRQSPQYISPGNPETGKDRLQIENIELSISENVSIQQYELRVYNKRGDIIFSIMDENLEGRGFFEEIFNVGDIPSVSIPDTMIWDGRNTAGSVVNDGEYFYQLYVRDSLDRRAFTAPLAVFVDTQSPEIVSLSSSTPVFSPNNDGTQDSISFFIQTEAAQTWTMSIQNELGDSVIRSESVASGDTAVSDILAPSRFDWDGVNSSRQPSADGNYTFVLIGVDRAGNSVQQELNFVLSTVAADISVDIEGNNPYFSFQNRETMEFRISLSNASGISNWNLEVSDTGEGIVYRRFLGEDGNIPNSIFFNGRGNPGRPERDNQELEDGSYTVMFTAFYENGNVISSDPITIMFDNTVPEAFIAADSSPIGREIPNPVYFGGEAKPELLLEATYDETSEWDIVIQYENQNEVVIPLSTALQQGYSLPYFWNGVNLLDGDGSFAPNGLYQINLRATDAAGNVGVSNPARFILDKASREGSTIELSEPSSGTVRITPVLPVTEGVEHFIISIINIDDNGTYFSRQTRDVLPYLDWRGRQNNNRLAPIGTYKVVLDILYFNGDNIIVESSQNIIMTANGPALTAPIVPEATLTASDGLFSPGDGINGEGDGINDTVILTIGTNTQSLRAWNLQIFDPANNLFRNWDGNGVPQRQITWDGLSNSGELVQSASEYTAVLNIIDEDNTSVQSNSEKILVDILVIQDGDRFRINVPSIQFGPNTADLFDGRIETENREQNFSTLRRLEEILNRDQFIDYAITIVGHAARIYTGERGQIEEREVLQPLSESRALEVKQSLTILGVDWDRMTDEGRGGTRPLVPHNDEENRWKNRRVEFILE